MPGEETVDADVFIELGPMDPVATADQFPFRLLGRRSMSQARVPRDGHRHGATIGQVHDQRVLGHADTLRSGLPNFKR